VASWSFESTVGSSCDFRCVFFNDVQLSELLLDKGITPVDTMLCNKRDIPPEFLRNCSRSVGLSTFGFSRKTTTVSYVPKKNKAVILTSTMHHDEPSIDSKSGKPDIILFYNSTKSGVDTVDYKYTTKRPTRRWPMCIFYGILNIAAINAMVIWMSNNKERQQGKKHKRRLFLEELGLQLVHEQLTSRAANPIGFQSHVGSASSLCGVSCTKQEEQAGSINSTSTEEKEALHSLSPQRRSKGCHHLC